MGWNRDKDVLHSNLSFQEGIWGGNLSKSGVRTLITARVQPGYVNCTRQGRLPGCLFMFDNGTAQCREGREGGCGLGVVLG